MSRQEDLQLMETFVQNVGLRKHMLAVEAAMRAYAVRLGQDEALWGTVGLLHDFDYERWPNPPDHPLQGSKILREKGYSEEIIYAILSHADYLPDYPRKSLVDKALFACDELCGFIMACALVRPERLQGLEAKSVKKKLKQASFAAAVNRNDIYQGAEDFQVELDTHIDFCISSMRTISDELGLNIAAVEKRE